MSHSVNKNNVVLSSSLEREINICTKNEETVTIFSEESNFDAAQISKKIHSRTKDGETIQDEAEAQKVSFFGTDFKFWYKFQISSLTCSKSKASE